MVYRQASREIPMQRQRQQRHTSCQGFVALNRGRIYDCGRVPPLPKRRNQRSGTPTGSGAGFTLIRFLTSSHTNRRRETFSESGWRRRIERGQILVEGIAVRDPDFALTEAKQRVQYYRRPWREPVVDVVARCLGNEARGETHRGIEENENDNDNDNDNNTSLEILHIDGHLMAVHKPRGLPTMPSQTFFDYSVLGALRHLNRREGGEKARQSDEIAHNNNNVVVASDAVRELVRSHCSAPPQPVHRLGVGTSGILVIATSVLARQRLTDAMRLKTHGVHRNQNKNQNQNAIRKTYRALVWAYRRDDRSLGDANGTPPPRSKPSAKRTPIPDSMTIDCPIGPVPFPIGGGTIHAARPRDTGVMYGHVHVHVPSQDANANANNNANANANNNHDANSNANANADDDRAAVTALPHTGVVVDSKPAVSHVTVVRRNHLGGDGNTNENENIHENEATAVVEVEIPTGRPHQIRIHMAYAGYPLVGDPLYLAGGIPDARPRPFARRSTEDEDLDTDDDEEEEEEGCDNDNDNDNDDEHHPAGRANTTTTRVALPRDCGYHLHAHRITLEHPSGTDAAGDATRGSIVTFTAPPPPLLR